MWNTALLFWYSCSFFSSSAMSIKSTTRDSHVSTMCLTVSNVVLFFTMISWGTFWVMMLSRREGLFLCDSSECLMLCWSLSLQRISMARILIIWPFSDLFSNITIRYFFIIYFLFMIFYLFYIKSQYLVWITWN